jgi:hypothetical protein
MRQRCSWHKSFRYRKTRLSQRIRILKQSPQNKTPGLLFYRAYPIVDMFRCLVTYRLITGSISWDTSLGLSTWDRES